MTRTGREIKNGVFWNFTEQLLRRGIGVGVTLVLALFLSPADFGLVAMMSVFLTVASGLMESGFKEAIIRLPKVTEADLNTAFRANLALGLGAYGLIFAAAPAIAAFYDEGQLTALLRVTALIVLVNAFQTVQLSKLSRALNFKLQLRAALPAAAISGGLAIGLAAAGLGVWALVGQMLAGAVITTLRLWQLQGWRPSRSFSWHSLSRMYRFGYKLFLASTLDQTFRNLYVLVIAKLFAASVAGLYFFADRLRDAVVSQLVRSIQEVTYPALASVQEDITRMREGYRKVTQVSTFLLFPAMTLLAALAPVAFELILPPRWQEAALYFQLMCLASLMTPLHAINLNILKVLERSDLFLFLEVVKKLILTGILLLSWRFGVVGILVGQIVGSVLLYVPNSMYSRKLIGYRVRDQITDFLPALVAALAAAGIAKGIVLTLPAGLWTQLLVGGMAGLITYYALTRLGNASGLSIVQHELFKSKS